MKTSTILVTLLLSSNLMAAAVSTDTVNQGLKLLEEGTQIHEKFAHFIEQNRCELGLKKECNKTPMIGVNLRNLKEHALSLYNWKEKSFAFSKELNSERSFAKKKERFDFLNEVEQKNIDAQDSLKTLRVKTAIDSLVYEENIFFAEVINQSGKLRTIINYDTTEVSHLLKKTFSFLSSDKKWNELKAAHLLFAREKELGLKGTLSAKENVFDTYIANSNFRRVMNNQNEIEHEVEMMLTKTRGARVADKIVGGLSKAFGNTAGLVQTRKGKLLKLLQMPNKLAEIKAKLRPLDLLFEKTPNRLTDKFIPGYFGHNAIWVGSHEELAKMEVDYNGSKISLLMHPEVLPHLEKISQGKLIVEALRSGVQMNTLEHFLDIDDFLVVRNNQLPESEKPEHLLRAFRQVGKKYDFNFNVETDAELVCSELIYIVFNKEVWPTSRSLKRSTISPDQVAWKALDDCYETIILFKHGEEVQENLAKEAEGLLSLPGAIPYTPVGSCLSK